MKKIRDQLIFNILWLVLFILSLASNAYAGSEDPTDIPEGNKSVYRFAVISDSHIKGGAEIDTRHAIERFKEVGAELSKLGLDFIVHTGDHVNDLYCTKSKIDIECIDYKKKSYVPYKCCNQLTSCYGNIPITNRPRCPPSVLGKYAKLVKENFPKTVPFYMVLGNHDDRILGSTIVRNSAKHEWLRVFGTEKSDDYYNKPARYSYKSPKDKHIKTYYEVTYGGFQLLMMDCMLHKPKGCKDPKCNDEIHFSKKGHTEQLQWMKERLTDKKYHSAILFWHTRVKEFDKSKNAFLQNLADHKDRIKMIFTGHGHHFAEDYWKEMPGIPFYQTTSTVCRFDKKFDPPIPAYFLVELNEKQKTITITNYTNIFGTKERKAAAGKACAAY